MRGQKSAPLAISKNRLVGNFQKSARWQSLAVVGSFSALLAPHPATPPPLAVFFEAFGIRKNGRKLQKSIKSVIFFLNDKY
jgi:hypothetical protein